MANAGTALPGYRLPAEYERHSATWMMWPTRREIWGDKFEAVKDDYARLATTIARFEPLTMVATAADAADARHRCGTSVRVLEMPIDDSWARDAGPVFVQRDDGCLVASAWRFTAWGGKYAPYDQDARFAARVAADVGVPVVSSTLALEGGAILSDGEGTVLTTETCLLNSNRNPGLSKAEVESELKRVFGARTVIWLPGDPTETETNGHIDGLVALSGSARALVEVNDDPSDERFEILNENRRALELARDAKGRSFQIQTIEEVSREHAIGDRYCRSYVNFYIANGAVIAPAYHLPSDERVATTLRLAFPDRTVVMLPIGAIAEGGGGFHCITQQQPAA
jgi:agmatine deiminase